MNTPASGYALMGHAEASEEAYSYSPLAQKGTRIERLTAFFSPKSYRGIERFGLNADYPYVEPSWQCVTPAT
jgi:hypothetical protein